MTKNLTIADLSMNGLLEGKAEYRVLYKYQRITEHSLDALSNRYVYFSSFHQLNDPFDPFITVIASKSNDGLIAAISSNGPKIFCLCESAFDPLMWAHYGDSAAGMCIGYAVFTGNPRIFNPVRYIDQLPVRMNVMDMLATKSRLWEREKEWRACFGGDQQKYKNIAHPVSISLGPKCTTANFNRVKNAMPETIKEFDIVLPEITQKGIAYSTYDVDALVKTYNRIPTLEEIFSGTKISRLEG